VASFVVSLLSWSHGIGLGQFPAATTGILLHLAFHAVYGAIAAVPTRRRATIIAMALSALAIDLDHLAYYLGWPVPPRASHSLFFLVLAPILMALAARFGLLGREMSPRMAAGMALATVMSHLAWDAVTAGETRIPFWLPFSVRPVLFSTATGAMLEVGAAVVMWWAAIGQNIHVRLPRSWLAGS